MQERVSIEAASGKEVPSEQLRPKKRRYTISEACDKFRAEHFEEELEAFKREHPEMGFLLDEAGSLVRDNLENAAMDILRDELKLMHKIKRAGLARKHVSMSADSERGREIHSAALGFVEGLMDNPELYTYAKGMSSEERDALFASMKEELMAPGAQEYSTEFILQAIAAHKESKEHSEQPEGAAADASTTTAPGLGK